MPNFFHRKSLLAATALCFTWQSVAFAGPATTITSVVKDKAIKLYESVVETDPVQIELNSVYLRHGWGKALPKIEASEENPFLSCQVQERVKNLAPLTGERVGRLTGLLPVPENENVPFSREAEAKALMEMAQTIAFLREVHQTLIQDTKEHIADADQLLRCVESGSRQRSCLNQLEELHKALRHMRQMKIMEGLDKWAAHQYPLAPESSDYASLIRSRDPKATPSFQPYQAGQLINHSFINHWYENLGQKYGLLTPKVSGASHKEAQEAAQRYSGDLRASLASFNKNLTERMSSWEQQKESLRSELRRRDLSAEQRRAMEAELEKRLELADRTRGNEQIYRNIGFMTGYLAEMQRFYRSKYIEALSRFPILAFLQENHETNAASSNDFAQDLKQALGEVKTRAEHFLDRVERIQPEDLHPEVFRAEPPRNPRPSKSAWEFRNLRKYIVYEAAVNYLLSKKPEYCGIAHKTYKSLVAYEKNKAIAKNAAVTVASTGCGLLLGLKGWVACFSIAASSTAYDVLRDFSKAHRDIEYEFGRVRNDNKIYQMGIGRINDNHRKRYTKAILKAIVLAKAVIPGGELVDFDTGSQITDAVLENVGRRLVAKLREQGVTAVIEGKQVVRLSVPTGDYDTFAEFQAQRMADGERGQEGSVTLDLMSLIKDAIAVGGGR